MIEPAPGIAKPKKPLFGKISNLKLILIIGVAVCLVAVVVIILLFVFNGNNSKSGRTTTTSNTSSSTNSSTSGSDNTNGSSSSSSSSSNEVSSLTCTKTGDSETFPTYGNVLTAKENIIAMYADSELTSFGTNLSLTYPSEEDALTGLSAARSSYNSILNSVNLTTDPFTSAYNADGTDVTVTHQADGDEIDSTNARVFGFYVVRGEIATDPETLTDMYESNGYTCETK